MPKDRIATTDGRRMLTPHRQDIVDGTRPIAVRAAVARGMVRRFAETGESRHSCEGATLWVIVEHCRVNRVPVQLEVCREGSSAGGPIVVIGYTARLGGLVPK